MDALKAQGTYTITSASVRDGISSKSLVEGVQHVVETERRWGEALGSKYVLQILGVCVERNSMLLRLC